MLIHKSWSIALCSAIIFSASQSSLVSRSFRCPFSSNTFVVFFVCLIFRRVLFLWSRSGKNNKNKHTKMHKLSFHVTIFFSFLQYSANKRTQESEFTLSDTSWCRCIWHTLRLFLKLICFFFTAPQNGIFLGIRLGNLHLLALAHIFGHQSLPHGPKSPCFTLFRSIHSRDLRRKDLFGELDGKM